MNETKTMRQLHSIREKNYERMKHLSVKEQIKLIQAEAEPIKKRLLEKIKKENCPHQADNNRLA
jgi:hypothetical protein